MSTVGEVTQRIDVTQDDIDKAIRSDSSRCVVAQAIARHIPTASRISVDIQTVRFTDGRGVRRVYLTPAGVEQYIVGFDAGDTITPFSFGLYDSQRVNEGCECRECLRLAFIHARLAEATTAFSHDAP